MNKIKKGNIVARKSYGKDIIFSVKNIITTNKGKIAILEGIIERIEADSQIEDLEIVEKRLINEKIEKLNKKIENKITQSKKNSKITKQRPETRNKEIIITGKILHLDRRQKIQQKIILLLQKIRTKCNSKKYTRIQTAKSSIQSTTNI